MIRFFVWSGLLCALLWAVMAARLVIVREQPPTGRLIMVRERDPSGGFGDLVVLTEDTRWVQRIGDISFSQAIMARGLWMRDGWIYSMARTDDHAAEVNDLKRVNIWQGPRSMQQLRVEPAGFNLILGWLNDDTLVIFTRRFVNTEEQCSVGLVDVDDWSYRAWTTLQHCYDPHTVAMMRYPAHIVINDTYSYAWVEHPQTGGRLTTADWIALPPEFVADAAPQATSLPLARMTAPYYFGTPYNLYHLSPNGRIESLATQRTMRYGIPTADDWLVWAVTRLSNRGQSAIWREDEQHQRTRVTPPAAYILGSATDASGRYAYFMVTFPDSSHWRLDTETGAVETVSATKCLYSDYHINQGNVRYRYCLTLPPSLENFAPITDLEFVGYVPVPTHAWRLDRVSSRATVGVVLVSVLVVIGALGFWGDDSSTKL